MIFLSYCQQDSYYAEQIKRAIIDILGDEEIRTGGRDGNDRDKDSIRECSLFVVILSHSATREIWSFSELTTAVNEKKPILPIVVDQSRYHGDLDMHLKDIPKVRLCEAMNVADRERMIRDAMPKGLGRAGKSPCQNKRIPSQDVRPMSSAANNSPSSSAPTQSESSDAEKFSPQKFLETFNDFDDTDDTQVFISHRREGCDRARCIMYALQEYGIKVFFDVESLSNEDFCSRILSAIHACSHLLLVVTPSALDECILEDDWVAFELRAAIKYQKNIVLSWKDSEWGKWPKLPSDIEKAIRYKNHHKHDNNKTFKDTIETLRTEFLGNIGSRRDARKPVWQYKFKSEVDGVLQIDGMKHKVKAEEPLVLTLPAGDYIKSFYSTANKKLLDEDLALNKDLIERYPQLPKVSKETGMGS